MTSHQGNSKPGSPDDSGTTPPKPKQPKPKQQKLKRAKSLPVGMAIKTAAPLPDAPAVPKVASQPVADPQRGHKPPVEVVAPKPSFDENRSDSPPVEKVADKRSRPRPLPTAVEPSTVTPVVSPSAETTATEAIATDWSAPASTSTPTAATPLDAIVPVATVQNAFPVFESSQPNDEEETDAGSWTMPIGRENYASWGVSMLVHMVLLIVLGLWVFAEIVNEPALVLTVSEAIPPDDEEIEEEQEHIEIKPLDEQTIDVPVDEQISDTAIVLTDDLLEQLDSAESSLLVESMDVATMLAAGDLMTDIPIPAGDTLTGEFGGAPDRAGGGSGNKQGNGAGQGQHGTGGDLGGRAKRREKIRLTDDGLSEPFVEKGLMWLAHHQLADGGWSYEHRNGGDCRGQCGDPGTLKHARFAATGMALLPFLGAGYTPTHGPYKKNVGAGLAFLLQHMGGDGGLVDAEGRMYGHGIATLALCEAFGMLQQMPPEGDYAINPLHPDGQPKTPEELKAEQEKKERERDIRVNLNKVGGAARRAAQFTNRAQAPNGGWRYKPGQQGDTSVVGWQIMALKSAKDAGLTFDPRVRRSAILYLNSVQGHLVGDEIYGHVGTEYAYMHGKHVTRATSAIGVLCRIYMGLSPNHPAVETVVTRMLNAGHGGGDMYFNYYANQIMYQHGGAEWKQWSKNLGGMLRGSQVQQGHLKGSWYMVGDHGSSKGGRLYCTAMALLCLEEHYRHMRLFRNAAGNQQPPPAVVVGEFDVPPEQPEDNAAAPDAKMPINDQAVDDFPLE